MQTNTKPSFSIVRQFGTLCIIVLIFMLTGCSGFLKKEEPPTGSIIRMFTLVDEYGRRSGELKIDPFGDIRLYEANGELIMKLMKKPVPEFEPAIVTD